MNGKKLRFMRVKRGIKQAWVAEQAGIDPATLCRIEMGRILPTSDEVGRIKKALGLDKEGA